MSRKRKGKVDLEPSIISTNSKGKRMRENGRLKIQDDDSDLEEMHHKLLRDAGVDEEMMKTIPEVERQAIIKAICESKSEPNKDVMVSPWSGEIKESSSVSPISIEDENETQPPDDFVGSEKGPSQLSLDIQLEEKQDKSVIEKPLELRDGSQPCTDYGDSNSLTSTPEAKIVDIQRDKDVTQRYHQSVLATETQWQWSPSHGRDRADLVAIPESPDTVNLDNVDDELNEKCSEADCGPSDCTFTKPRAKNQQEFPPRYSPKSIKDPSLYTQVICLMFNIYSRRLRSVQNSLKGKPVQWGKPVRKGVHWENSLRREVLDQENKDVECGRGRRPIRKRSQKESNADVPSPERICNKSKNHLKYSKAISRELLPVINDDDVDELTDKETISDDDFDPDIVPRVIKNKTKKVHIVETQKVWTDIGRGSRYMKRNKAKEVDNTYDLSAVKKGNVNWKDSERMIKPQNMFKSLSDKSAHSSAVVDVENLDVKAMTNRTDIDQEVQDPCAESKKKHTSVIDEDQEFLNTKIKRKKKSPDESIQKCSDLQFPLHSSSTTMLKKKNDRGVTNFPEDLNLSSCSSSMSYPTKQNKEKNVTKFLIEEQDIPLHSLIATTTTAWKKKNNNSIDITNGSDEEMDLPSHQSPTPSSAKQQSDKVKMIPDVEVVEDFERDSKNVSGFWLSSKKGKEIRETKVVRRQNKKGKDRPDMPLGEESVFTIVRRKGKKFPAKTRGSLSKALIMEDVCVIDDNGMEFNEIGDNDSDAGEQNGNSTKLLMEDPKTEDVPSSLESGYFLDPKGDMYCTQFDPKAKEAMKRKSVEKADEEMEDKFPSNSKFVVLSSRRKKQRTELDNENKTTFQDSSKKTASRVQGRKKQSDTSQDPQGEGSSECNIRNSGNDDNNIDQTREKAEESYTDMEDQHKKCTDLIMLNKTKKRKVKLFDMYIDEEMKMKLPSGAENKIRIDNDDKVRSETSKKIKIARGKQKQLDTIQDDIENDQDIQVFSESTITTKSGLTTSSSSKRGSSKKACPNMKTKRKRTPFDLDISNEKPELNLSDDIHNNNRKEEVLKRKESTGVVEKSKQDVHPGTSQEERNQWEEAGKYGQPTAGDDHTQTNIDEGTCPICDKMFPLTDLEAHASTCGEGEEPVTAEASTVECMICHKEIDRENLKEHQAHCANMGDTDREEPPTRRQTRAKKSGHQRIALLREATSPFSSGEDYGELYVEVDKRKK